jgi:DNA polymerase-3 subunit delta'
VGITQAPPCLAARRAEGCRQGELRQGGRRRILADAAGPPSDLPGLATDDGHPIVKLVEAGSHPDMRWLERLENEKTGNLARNISVDQVRDLGEFLTLTPALSDWRVAVIDTADELEQSGAIALLKILEEPPPNTIFLLVSHAPGRLLPTIRSRCRRLDFSKLDDDAMTSILQARAPSLGAAERDRVIAMANGSAGRALGFAEFGLAKIEDSALAILRQGDPTNGRRSDLAQELGKRGAGDRYAAFLDIARRSSPGRRANSTVHGASGRSMPTPRRANSQRWRRGLSLDPAATIFQLGGSSPRLPTSRFLEGLTRHG